MYTLYAACIHIGYIHDQIRWPNVLSNRLPLLVDGEIRTHGFYSWSSQTNGLAIYTCRFLPSQALGIDRIEQQPVGSGLRSSMCNELAIW